MGDFKLSQKYKDFLKYNGATVEILEGTTKAGKTTIGIIKFMLKVASSPKKIHLISARDLGVAAKNIVNKELGITEIFGSYVKYNSKGAGNETLAHISYHTPNGDKIIYVMGYDTVSRWQSILGGQYGCIYIDEINIADMAYVKQCMMRCDYLMGTLNPDDPDKPIYKQYINRCRPIEKYKDDAPPQLLEMLDEPAEDGWVWWYFDFDDNCGLTEKNKEKIRKTHTPGSIEYKRFILGLRGKMNGVIFDNFILKNNTITEKQALEMVQGNKDGEKFVQFTAGLDTAYSVNSPDAIAMSFMGITNKRNLYYLDEVYINNAETKNTLAPSDTVIKYIEFLEKNRKRYGFARDTFFDSADQGIAMEFAKYKSRHGAIYNFNPAYKKLKIIDRIVIQKGWIAQQKYKVVETCNNHIREMQVYSWSEKKKDTPEDGNDHTINSQQYAWIPYQNIIG